MLVVSKRKCDFLLCYSLSLCTLNYFIRFVHNNQNLNRILCFYYFSIQFITKVWRFNSLKFYFDNFLYHLTVKLQFADYWQPKTNQTSLGSMSKKCIFRGLLLSNKPLQWPRFKSILSAWAISSTLVAISKTTLPVYCKNDF